MTSIPINPDRDKMNLLLDRLANRMLDREAARELYPLLQNEAQNARQNGDFEREDDLLALMDVLASYISGRIDLMIQPTINVALS